MIHDIEQFDPSNDFSDYYIRFDDKYELELIPKNYHLKVLNVPKALQEVFSLGVIWVEGVPLQRCFCHPKDVTKAMQKEYLQDFLDDPDFQHFPLNELRTFYVDSGCWLMYDDQEQVYCGGFECGDFYQTAQNVEEAIYSIFEKLNNYVIDPKFGFNPSIESFVTRI